MIYTDTTFSFDVNGSYMNTGSKYSVQITPVQEPQQDIYHENRETDDYPPIGRLVPIGYSISPAIVFCLIYVIVYKKIKK